jgi:hypothetical protein
MAQNIRKLKSVLKSLFTSYYSETLTFSQKNIVIAVLYWTVSGIALSNYEVFSFKLIFV